MDEYEEMRQEAILMLSIIPLDNKKLLMAEFGIDIEDKKLLMPFTTEN